MRRPVWDDRLSTGCALGMIETLLREGFIYGQVVCELAKLGEKTERELPRENLNDDASSDELSSQRRRLVFGLCEGTLGREGEVPPAG